MYYYVTVTRVGQVNYVASPVYGKPYALTQVPKEAYLFGSRESAEAANVEHLVQEGDQVAVLHCYGRV